MKTKTNSKKSPCRRCGGSGRVARGTCYGCRGSGVGAALDPAAVATAHAEDVGQRVERALVRAAGYVEASLAATTTDEARYQASLATSVERFLNEQLLRTDALGRPVVGDFVAIVRERFASILSRLA
jgi:hypothetical protein